MATREHWEWVDSLDILCARRCSGPTMRNPDFQVPEEDPAIAKEEDICKRLLVFCPIIHCRVYSAARDLEWSCLPIRYANFLYMDFQWTGTSRVQWSNMTFPSDGRISNAIGDTAGNWSSDNADRD